MCKEQNVLNYYVVCNKLKNVIREETTSTSGGESKKRKD